MENPNCLKTDTSFEEMVEGTDLSMEFLQDPRNWINAAQLVQLVRNRHKSKRLRLSHNDYMEIAEESMFARKSLVGLALKALPLEASFRKIAENSSRLSNLYTVLPEYFTNEIGAISIRNHPYFQDITAGHDCRFYTGIITKILSLKGIDPANYVTRQPFCGIPIRTLVDRFYEYQDWEYEEKDGAIYLEGRKIAVQTELALLDDLHPMTRELLFKQNIQSARAYRVIADFVWDGKDIFKTGEVYGAPFCLLEIAWGRNLGSKRTYQSIRRQEIPIFVDQMLEQVEFSNEKVFEVNRALKESERKSEIFKKYTRKSLVDVVDAGEDPTVSPATRKNVAVLFSDIRDFTTFSENMPPIEVVDFLNRYFNVMNAPIDRYGGEIDKLMGDCIMAYFDDPVSAAKASVDLRKALAILNASLDRRKYGEIRNGVGISYGPVIMGNIGSFTKLDFTLIGDTVNIASRLESLTKHYGLGVIATDEVVQNLPQPIESRFIDTIIVKGKSEPIQIYEILTEENDEARRRKLRNEVRHKAAFALYVNSEFAEARRIYAEMDAATGHIDPLARFFMSRCTAMDKRLKNGELKAREWDGIYRFDAK